MTNTLLSLCTGYGGLDLAIEALLDVELVAFAEFDKHAALVASTRFPSVPNLGDITKIDWEEVSRMAAHRKDELAEAMYDRYCQGFSVEQVAEEFDRSRQSVWKMFQRRGWDLRPRPPARPTVSFGGHSYAIGTQGYYRRTDGNRSVLHRDVWEAAYGTIPDEHDVHHIDHDKTNNDLSNLQCLPKADHARLHHEEVMPTDSRGIDVITAGYP